MNITTNTFVEKDENKDENDIIINESNEVNYSKLKLSKISEITLEYLMNKKDYKKYQTIKNASFIQNIDKDRLFYQKRINDMTRYFMNRSSMDEERYYPDYLVSSFDNYLETVIEYFKTIDKTDIIQEDYIGLQSLEKSRKIYEDDNEDDTNMNENTIIMDIDMIQTKSLFMKQTITPTLLDNFIKVNKKEEAQTDIISTAKQFPLQRDIQLDDPKLKMKGISYHKNKNITNKYEEKNDSQTTIVES